MNDLQTLIKNYLDYCQYQKILDTKTLKAYQVDLAQFSEQLSLTDVLEISPNILEDYIAHLHQKYKPKSVKRKIASLKAFFITWNIKTILKQILLTKYFERCSCCGTFICYGNENLRIMFFKLSSVYCTILPFQNIYTIGMPNLYIKNAEISIEKEPTDHSLSVLPFSYLTPS